MSVSDSDKKRRCHYLCLIAAVVDQVMTLGTRVKSGELLALKRFHELG